MTKIALLSSAGIGALLLFMPEQSRAQGHACNILSDQMNSGTPAARQAARTQYNRRCVRQTPTPPRRHRQTHSPAPPPVYYPPAPPPPPPPPPPAPQARSIHVYNSCSTQLTIRLIYYTSGGLTYPPAPNGGGGVWRANAGESLDLAYANGGSVTATSDLFYVHVTDSNGVAWSYPSTFTYQYGPSDTYPFHQRRAQINNLGQWLLRFC